MATALAKAPALAPLRGVPFLAKDLFDFPGAPTRAGSPFLADVRPVQGESALVRRLHELGAALAGKTHLVEFAAGLTGENRTFGDCPHPCRPERMSGGSSSGSAALVKAGVVPLALGSDTGGSVRVPAGFCGVFGFRLTPGDAFIRDAVPLSPSLDTAGWFTADASDMRETLAALVGETSGRRDREPHGAFLRAKELWSATDVALDEACARKAAELSGPVSASVRDELLAAWRGAVGAYGVIATHEAHAVHQAWLGTHRADYDPVIWQRFMDGGRFTAEAVAEARIVATRVRTAFDVLWREVDFLVLPSAPVAAPTKAECTPELRQALLTFTTPASLAGVPCLTVPVRLPDGMMTGLQILASSPDSPVFDWALARLRELA